MKLFLNCIWHITSHTKSVLTIQWAYCQKYYLNKNIQRQVFSKLYILKMTCSKIQWFISIYLTCKVLGITSSLRCSFVLEMLIWINRPIEILQVPNGVMRGGSEKASPFTIFKRKNPKVSLMFKFISNIFSTFPLLCKHISLTTAKASQPFLSLV